MKTLVSIQQKIYICMSLLEMTEYGIYFNSMQKHSVKLGQYAIG